MEGGDRREEGGGRTGQLTLYQLCFDDARLDTLQPPGVLINWPPAVQGSKRVIDNLS